MTGSPMKEVILAHQKEIDESKVLETLGLSQKKYIVLSAHREENIDHVEHFESLMNAVNSMAEAYQMPVIYSLHPRSAKFVSERGFEFHPLVKAMPPFNFTDYSHLMEHAYCVVSDSGTMPEETAVSHFPAVCIRTSTERPEALDKGCFVIGGITEESLLQSVDMAVKMADSGDFGEKVVDYEVEKVSSTVIRIIQSYTSIIDDKVWRKQG